MRSRISRLPAFVLMTVVVSLSSAQGVKRIDPATIPDDEYARANEQGHLIIKGERLRFWGAIGGFPSNLKKRPRRGQKPKPETPEEARARGKRARVEVDALVQRLIDMGFNLQRIWYNPRGKENYTPGDGSQIDVVDYYISVMKKRGLRFWGAGINRHGHITAADVNIIDDPKTAKEWQAAMAQWQGGKASLYSICRKWDRRFEAKVIADRKAAVQHYNKYTGLRWADDPVFVAWELSNEEWWISKMVGGQWRKLPPYWQEMLYRRWNDWLREKYKTDAALAKRWGKLLPGESLKRGTVQLLPTRGPQDVGSFHMDEQGKKQLLAAQSDKQKYSRKDFKRERGEDVIAFFVHLHISSKRREAEAFKTFGKSCRLTPLAWDTGIGYEIQAQYLHQNADVSVHDAYVNGWGQHSRKPETFRTEMSKWLYELSEAAVLANEGPWISWLQKPPGICQGVPWLEHNKVEGKPYFAYETQIQQPAKYRADYPLRLAALASIQDWDIACWHYFAPPNDISTNPKAFSRPMDITVGRHPQGYHFTYDEVQTAMMRAAGIIWRNQALKPAPKPTKFIFGRKSLCDPDSMDYGHSYGVKGLDMLPTVYQYGVRIEIDPTREDDEVIGPVVSIKDRKTHNPYTPTQEITFDWKKGYLVYDAPAAAAFTGFLPNAGGTYKFSNGVILAGIDINNPPGIYEPITNKEGYIAFALYSEDGKSLATCRKAAVSLVSTSFNKGFALAKQDFGDCPDHPLAKTAGKRRKRGGTPVNVARVAGTVTCRAIDGMSFTAYDWNMQPINKGTVRQGVLRIPNDKPVFLIRLRR